MQTLPSNIPKLLEWPLVSVGWEAVSLWARKKAPLLIMNQKNQNGRPNLPTLCSKS